MSKTVDPEKFASACEDLIEEYGDEVLKTIKELIPDAADYCVKEIRSHSRGKKYPKGWTKKEQFMHGVGSSYVVYNRTKYRIAHLLENSHVVANKYGTYGTTEGDHVIRDAEERTEEWLQEQIQKALGG